MYKRLTFETSNEKGIFLYTIGEGRDQGYLTKTAGCGNFHPQIEEYLNNATPISGKTQVLLTALGAMEHYGSNVNGDAFPQVVLKYEGPEYGHKTFESCAKVYKHHINKDPAKSYGDVILSVWNERMKRVELIVTIDHSAAPDLVERVDAGEYPEVSMGCLRGNAPILMSDFREKKVCEMAAGDKIIDGTGRNGIVSYAHSHIHKGTWIKPSIYGIQDVEPTTEEHPWKVIPKEQLVCAGNPENKSRRQSKCTPRSNEKKGCVGCSRKESLNIVPEWVRADKLREGDFVGTPILQEEVPCPESESFISLLGWYLAEGFITSDGYPVLAVNHLEVDRIKKVFENIYTFKVSPSSSSPNCNLMTIYDKSLGSKLLQYAGKRADSKLLSPEVCRWEKRTLLTLLGTYLNGDGGTYKGSAYFSTCNQLLAKQIQALLLKVGIISSCNVNLHKPSTVVNKDTVEYQVWCGKDTSYILKDHTWKEGLQKSTNINDKRFISNGYLWSPIIEIETEECDEEVFNIAIESGDDDRDSYIVNSISLHNCKVPYDVCSICGNKAKTRKDYCDHLRYYMNKIPPGHTKIACAINTLPRFFDISFVLIGADRIASVMKKVAHTTQAGMVSSALMAEKQPVLDPSNMSKTASYDLGLAGMKTAEERKQAEIEKEVPSNLDGNTVSRLEDAALKGREALEPLEPEMDKKIIIRISSGNQGMEGLSRIMSTLGLMGIVPKPKEFQSIALRSLGRQDLADEYERLGLVFSPNSKVPQPKQCTCDQSLKISPEKFNPGVFDNVCPMMEDRSYSRPLLAKRIIRLVKLAEDGKLQYPKNEHVKTAEEEDPDKIGLLPMMLTLTGLYVAMKGKLPQDSVKGMDGILGKHPGLTAALGIGGVAGADALLGRSVKGKYDFDPDEAPTDMGTWEQEIKKKNLNPIVKTGSVAKRLFLGVPALYMASGMQEVKRARNPYEEEGSISAFIRKHPDIASGALVGEALAGGPVTKGIKNMARGGLNILRKTASIEDDLLSTAVFSLAFPGSSAAVRAATTAVDYGIISGIEKLLKKKKGTI